MMWGWGYGGYGAPWGWIGPILMVLFWIAVAIGIAFLVRYLVRSGRRPAEEDSALEILRRRYAKGEISKEEFEEKRKDLQ
jgi:putative membrane protein